MLKRILHTGMIGALSTEFFVILYFTLQSLLQDSNVLTLVTPMLIEKFGSYNRAFLFQYILVAISGIIYGISANIFKVDFFPRIVQFICHFIIIIVTWWVSGLLCCWINKNLKDLLIYFGIFFLVYFLVYFIILTIERIEISSSNKKINSIKRKQSEAK